MCVVTIILMILMIALQEQVCLQICPELYFLYQHFLHIHSLGEQGGKKRKDFFFWGISANYFLFNAENEITLF